MILTLHELPPQALVGEEPEIFDVKTADPLGLVDAVASLGRLLNNNIRTLNGWEPAFQPIDTAYVAIDEIAAMPDRAEQAKAAAQRAAEAVENGEVKPVPLATTELLGKVMPDGVTMLMRGDTLVTAGKGPIVVVTVELQGKKKIAPGQTRVYTVTGQAWYAGAHVNRFVVSVDSAKLFFEAVEGTATFEVVGSNESLMHLEAIAVDNSNNQSLKKGLFITVVASFVDSPAILLPPQNATVWPDNLRIKTSDFVVIGVADTHLASRYVIFDLIGTLIWDSGETNSLTEITVAEAGLVPGELYKIGVQHQGEECGWSDLSDFTTIKIYKE